MTTLAPSTTSRSSARQARTARKGDSSLRSRLGCHPESANLCGLAAGAWRGEAGVAVVHVAVVDAHAVRIGIRRPRQRHDLENLAGFRIDLLHQMVPGDQNPERAVVPVKSVRSVAARRT